MTALLYTAGVLLFALGIAASIGLHELGHLIPGKLFDVKVTQYFIGFGRTIWSRKRGETEYGVKAIPLGGYVKLVGMLPPETDAEPEMIRSRNTGMFAQLVSDARAAEYEHVGPHEHHRLFYNKPWWQRVVIMGCGVTINLVIAFVLLAIVFMVHGVQVESTTVGVVSQCVKVVHASDTVGGCGHDDPVAPAARAGLRPGDRIVSFNGVTINDYGQLQRLIRSNSDGRATIVVDRAGSRRTLHTSTVVHDLQAVNDPNRMVRVGFLGISPQIVWQRQGIGFVAHTMVDSTWSTLKTIGALPVKVYHAGRAALGLEKRDPNGPMSVVGAGRVAGDIASEHVSVSDRLFELLGLLGSLNLFLGLVNLVPLPPFDGGGIATTLVEAARRGIARLRRRPDPGGLDAAKLLPLTYAMATLLIAFSVVLILADIVAPIPFQQ
ncbi:MAG: site-2 protease family protein [Nocardioidaceae bacterium]|nr:site-2 protease family protein [Nocardioidaceae bacterium]